MSRLSSLLLLCAVLCCTAVSLSAAYDLDITATYNYQGNTYPLNNGGITMVKDITVTFYVALSAGANAAGETITMSCTDSAGVPATVGSFVSPNSLNLASGTSECTFQWLGSTTPVQPVRCTAIGDTDYTTRSPEFLLYNGMGWTVTVDDTALTAGQETTMTVEVFPAHVVAASGGSVTFTVDCEGLDVIDLPTPDRRRLLATSGSTTLISGQTMTSWSLTAPAAPQETITCTITRTGGMSTTSASETVVITMTLPTVTWDASFPSAVTVGVPVDVTLTLSQQCTGNLVLQGTCQSTGQPGTLFSLPSFSFQDELMKTFTIPAGVFVTPMSDVQCRVWFEFGDAYFTNLAQTWQSITFAIEAAPEQSSTAGGQAEPESSTAEGQIAPESSTGDEQTDSTAGGQQSDSTASQQQTSTASQQQSVSSSASQQSISSSAAVAASSGPIGGASSSTGVPCIPGLTCAATSAHASWAVLALAAAAVFGALSQ